MYVDSFIIYYHSSDCRTTVNSQTACHVIDCVSSPKFKDVNFCSPYACTSLKSTPIINHFDVTEYRKKGIDSAALAFRRVNPPYSYYNFTYTVHANDVLVYEGAVDGCKEVPRWISKQIPLNQDVIKIKWETIGAGWLLLGKDNCKAESTDAILKIGKIK